MLPITCSTQPESCENLMLLSHSSLQYYMDLLFPSGFRTVFVLMLLLTMLGLCYFSKQVSLADEGMHYNITYISVEQTTLVSVKMPLAEKRLQNGVTTEKFTTNVVTYKSSTSPAEIYRPLCDMITDQELSIQILSQEEHNITTIELYLVRQETQSSFSPSYSIQSMQIKLSSLVS